MGKTVGIIGMGAIGTRTAELLNVFGCRILGYKRHLTGMESSFIEFIPLDELLSRSDIVSLHCPLNEDSRHLINQDTIGKMKQGAYLINASRGPVVDSQALADALNSGYLSGAGIDVFETEPPLDTSHPLLHSKNTIVTPHVAFASAQSMEARAKIVFDNITKWLEGNQTNIVL
jgi:phosphoglycerate dehydrogenase-like enzyme